MTPKFRTLSAMAASAAMAFFAACSTPPVAPSVTPPVARSVAPSVAPPVAPPVAPSVSPSVTLPLAPPSELAAPPLAERLVPPPAMRVEGVPPLALQRLAAVQRYSQIAGHQFVEWHPTRREMLVAHRPIGASATQLFLMRSPMSPLQPLTSGSDPVSSGTWEPREGRYLVFTRARGGNEVFQLYRLEVDTGTVAQLTAPDQRHAFSGWLPSRQRILVASVPVDRTAAGGRRDQLNTTLSLVNPLQPQQRELLAELPGGGWFGAEVSPDEKTLAIVRYESATSSEVWLIDLVSGQRRRVLPAPEQTLQASHFVSGWALDGSALFFASNRASEFAELMRLDLANGAITRLSADTPWDVSSSAISPRSALPLAVLIANVDGREELRLIDPRSGAAYVPPAGAALPAMPAGSVTRAEFHPGRNELALVVNSAQGPAQVHSLDLSGPGAPRISAWTQPIGTDRVDLKSLPDQQIVRWTSFDGRSISGVLSLPPAHFGGRRPVVMMMHGGPEGQAKQGWQGRINYLIEQMGLAVLEPNVRGSSGYGKTFLGLDNGRLREDSVKDMGSAIDWIATHPRLDATRVAVAGGSYGGYMALAASTRLADRIAGAMSEVGISNFVSFLENTESYRRDLRRVEYGDERDPAMRSFLHSISPLTHVDKINKPLMVVQGKNDPRVPWTESEQIVRSLQSRGTPVWYLLADNEGHGFARRENADYYFVALTEFLQRILKP